MKGVLLINLGSPDDLNLSSIKKVLERSYSKNQARTYAVKAVSAVPLKMQTCKTFLSARIYSRASTSYFVKVLGGKTLAKLLRFLLFYNFYYLPT